MIKKTIGLLLYDNLNAQDLTGPLEAFHSVSNVTASPYEFVFIGEAKRAYRTEAGLMMLADHTLGAHPALDTIIIPGGAGAREATVQTPVCDWLCQIQPDVRRMVSVCTGAFLLAEAGLLKGMAATTHWNFTEQFQSQYPDISVKPSALYVNNGHIATSAGITSGIDLALSLIESDLGKTIATEVARYLVVHYQRAGDQAQYSAPLRFQCKAGTGFDGLTGYVLENLHRDLDVSDLAHYCGMSERNFFRKFSARMETSPALFIETLRLDYARQLLAENSWPIERLSEACGYRSADAFRRAFQRRFSISPTDYRARFG